MVERSKPLNPGKRVERFPCHEGVAAGPFQETSHCFMMSSDSFMSWNLKKGRLPVETRNLTTQLMEHINHQPTNPSFLDVFARFRPVELIKPLISETLGVPLCG